MCVGSSTHKKNYGYEEEGHEEDTSLIVFYAVFACFVFPLFLQPTLPYDEEKSFFAATEANQ